MDRASTSEYVSGRASFVAGLLPADAIALSWETVLDLLSDRYGDELDLALSADACDAARDPASLDSALHGPGLDRPDPSWIRRSNMVGINVRTVGSYAEVLKYAVTLPAAFDSVHLLPIWEPGVVKSLYGPSGWGLNTEFFSHELASSHPHLDTVERQVRATVNLLHVMGRAVGMEVIPHTDRFSETVLAQPWLFEWMRVLDDRIVEHPSDLDREVADRIFDWLTENGSADATVSVPDSSDEFFAAGFAESDRLRALFGDPVDLFGRVERRMQVVVLLRSHGFEPVPATMGVPFRRLRVDPDHSVVDDHGITWHDYLIEDPGPHARVFNPLARYKLYGPKDDNVDWEIDFDQPLQPAWDYVCKRYAAVQRVGGFDFMRGDMSHVQMRPDGVPHDPDEHYDLLRTVKEHIRSENRVPGFAYFAETFLPPRDVFAYGEEMDHLEASHADATLGDLQSAVVGSNEFLRRFRRYRDDLETRKTATAFGVMTADKDDPRFDEFYRTGNEIRYFTALFLTDMPSYTGLGFETRDVHVEPVENERYTKLFVFHERGESNVHPSKARFGDTYQWGENTQLFDRLTRLRLAAEEILPQIRDAGIRWLLPPDATTLRGTAVWTQEDAPHYVFLANYDVDRASGYFGIPGLGGDVALEAILSTDGAVPSEAQRLAHNGHHHPNRDTGPGEGRVYRVESI